MSGNDIGSIVGGAIGYFVGGIEGARLGMAIGGVAGGVLMPDEVGLQDQSGPRLNNLKVLSSSYGVPIPKIYGAYRVGGNIIWSTDIVETVHEREEEVGKGGGSESYTVTTYSYDVSFAVALCEGPVTGVRKVWADGVLIYDGTSTTAFYASSEYTSGPMDIFLGGDDQIIDWSMQTYNSDTPAYRNICYIRFNNLQLEKFGNRLPNITVEVVTEGVNEVAAFLEDGNLLDKFESQDAYRSIDTILANNYFYDYTDTAPIQDLSMLSFDGTKTYISTFTGSSNNYQAYGNIFLKYTNSASVHRINHENMTFERNQTVNGTHTPYFKNVPYPFHKNQDGGFHSYGHFWWGQQYITFHDNSNSLVDFHRIINIYGLQGDHGKGVNNWYEAGVAGNERVFYKDNFYCLETYTLEGSGLGCVLKGAGQKAYPEVDEELYSGFYKWNYSSYIAYGEQYEGSLRAIIGASTFPDSGDGPIGMDVNYDKIFLLTGDQNVIFNNKAYIKVYDLDGNAITSREITTDIDLGQYDANHHILRIFVGDSYIHILRTDAVYNVGHGYAKYTLDLQLVLYREFDSHTAVPSSVTRVAMQYKNGLVKSVHMHGISGSFSVQDWTINLNYITANVTLKTITDDLCKRSGLALADYDNGEGATVSVKGFSIPQNASARATLAVLQSVFLFDLVEEDFKIKLKMRQGSVLHTISEDNIIDNKIEISKTLQTELPRKITLEYSNPNIDYLTSSQALIRIDGNSDNNVKIQIPIALSDDEAKQLAEKLIYGTWKSDTELTFAIPFDKYILMGDVIQIEYKGINYIARVIQIITNTTNKMDLKCITDGDAVYISNATGSDTSEGFIAPTVDIPIASKAIVFNAPTLDNSVIDSFGIYYTALGYGDAWSGSEMFKSKDLGNTYENIGVCLPNTYSAIGSVLTPIASGPSTVWDLDSSVTVSLDYGELYSISLDSVLNGENYIKIGNEILQYANATDNLDGTYTLDTFLRGRRGTEWAIGLHEISELFIFLTNEINFSFSTINVERHYKSVSFDTYLDEAFIVSETYDGTNLKPFSPSGLTVIGDTITWIRRDRYISGYFNWLPLSEAQEKYKVELFELDVSQFVAYVTNATEYIYDDVTYPDIDKIQVSQYSDNLLEYGYVAEIII